MQEITSKWVEFAKEDLKAVEALITAPASIRSYQLSVLHCHQGVEKMIKALIVEQGKEVLKIHDLPRLMVLSGVNFPQIYSDFVKDLDPHYVGMRYPDLPSRGRSFHYDEAVARDYFERSKQFFLWAETILK